MGVKGMQRHKTLQEVLLESQAMTEEQLQEAEAEAASSNKPLQQIILDRKVMAKAQLLKVLTEGWQVEVADIEQMDISADLVKLIPEKLARRYTAVPIAKSENILAFAMANPCDLDIMEDLKLRTGLDIKPYLALPHEIFATLDAAYGKGGAPLIKAIMEEERPQIEEWALPKDAGLEMVKEQKSDIAKVDASAPEIEKLVNAIILNALALKASDIHIEPVEDPAGNNSRILLRYRVDGVLIPGFKIPWAYRHALAAKIKIMTNSMNITERRLPQSGRIQLLNKGNPIEFRVEMLPTVYGEACVMRILDRNSVKVDIKTMGFLPDTLDSLLGLLKGIGGKKNFGLILVCGPTGSGKSTTLYAALNHANRPDIKILTAENPVEYNIDGIVQIPVNPELKLGTDDKVFDFATALRSFLRFDPDVIMVGEIRDKETAHIALEAAMTGHLVFSTIHTNDAPSALSRLSDMGVPDFLVISTIKAVLAQRLSRRLCPDCKQPHEPTKDERKAFEENKVSLPEGTKLMGPVGCENCKSFGFRGRVGLHELMIMTDDLRAVCAHSHSTEMVRSAAMKLGMRTVAQDGLQKVLAGLTTVREVIGGAE